MLACGITVFSISTIVMIQAASIVLITNCLGLASTLHALFLNRDLEKGKFFTHLLSVYWRPSIEVVPIGVCFRWLNLPRALAKIGHEAPESTE